MAFTEAQVIQAARERVGNKIAVTIAEQAVPDQAIRNEMRDDVLVCCRTFGGGTASQRKTFVTVTNPAVATPGAPSANVTGQESGLLPGTYSYRISALGGTGETLAGAAVSVLVPDDIHAVISLTWSPVAEANGYRVYGRTAGSERLLASVAAGVTTWSDDGTAKRGGGMPLIDSVNAGYLQDYEIAAFLGDDVLEINQILRSDAFVSDDAYEPGGLVDPRTGLPTSGGGIIDFGLQRAPQDVVIAQERFRREMEFSYEVVQVGAVKYLRLIPRPTSAIYVDATFTTAGGTIATLPDEARTAMELSACRALLECMINRYHSNPPVFNESQVSDRRVWADAMRAQRDRYELRFKAAIDFAS